LPKAGEGNETNVPTDPSLAKKKSTKTKKPPRSAAVVLTYKNHAYASLIREIKSKVNLTELGITGTDIKMRPAITGTQMIKVTVVDKAAKADRLAQKIREVVKDREGVAITRPNKTAEFRIRNLEISLTPDDVREALAAKGQCSRDDILLGDIKGTFGGCNTVWVKCPIIPANKITAAGRLQIGWSTATIEPLLERPLQCFRCLEGGHVAARCPSKVDRSGRCHRCGEKGHMVRTCFNEPKCIACVENKFPTGHKSGSPACQSAKLKRKGRREDPPPHLPLGRLLRQ